MKDDMKGLQLAEANLQTQRERLEKRTCSSELR